MSLRHGLLALLTAQSMTGYDLGKVFERSVDYAWHAPHSQIYPELRRMEADGLVTAELALRGARGTKRTYAITEEGRRELERWVAEPAPIERPRDVARLRSMYLEFATYDDARRHFQAHLDHYEQWQRRWELHARQIEALETALIRARLDAPGTGDPTAVVAYKVHAYRGLAAQAGLEVAWAREGLALVDRLEGSTAEGRAPSGSIRNLPSAADLTAEAASGQFGRRGGRRTTTRGVR